MFGNATLLCGALRAVAARKKAVNLPSTVRMKGTSAVWQ